MAPDRVRPGKVEPRTVLFDSSFLIAVMEHPTPWREDISEKIGAFTPVVIRPVYDELSRLAARRGGGSRFASLAKDVVDRGDLELRESVGAASADDELMSLALSEHATVATLDKKLMESLRASGVPVVFLSRGRVSV